MVFVVFTDLSFLAKLTSSVIFRTCSFLRRRGIRSSCWSCKDNDQIVILPLKAHRDMQCTHEMDI